MNEPPKVGEVWQVKDGEEEALLFPMLSKIIIAEIHNSKHGQFYAFIAMDGTLWHWSCCPLFWLLEYYERT